MPVKTALLIIDVQNDYFPGGLLPLFRPVETAETIRSLLDYFRQTHQPVVHIQHISANPNAPYLRPETPGIEIHNSVKPRDDEPVVTKHTPNSFHETNLLQILRDAEVANLVITGMMTQTCVDSTTRAAKDYGFNCIVPSDTTTTKDFDVEGEKISATTMRRAFLAGLQIHYAQIDTTANIMSKLKGEN